MIPGNTRQRGVALVTALMLLIVITLLGLAAVRGTGILQKLTGNFYDREMAFQAAEAAMQAASQQISAGTAVVARNCGTGATACYSNPFNDGTLPSGSIQSVATGTGTGQFTQVASTFNTGSAPQYVIENMGAWIDPSSDTGVNHTANASNYGGGGGTTTSTYYRVTARSGDPTVVNDRAVVYLQALYKE
jgi:type IV pilus assembly protein PilX